MFDDKFMLLALDQARLALDKDEVPIGAVIVYDGKVLSAAHNITQTSKLTLSHAELICLTLANEKLNNFRLAGCDIYITAEPCMMCLGAMCEARIANIYFGCFQEKMGAFTKHRITTSIPHIGGIRKQESISLLQEFFSKKRK